MNKFALQTVSIVLAFLVGCTLPPAISSDVDQPQSSSQSLTITRTRPPAWDRSAELIRTANDNAITCRAVRVFNARLPYANISFAELGVSSAERTRIQQHFSAAENAICVAADRVAFKDAIADAGQVVSGAIERFKRRLDVVPDIAEETFWSKFVFDLEQMEELCGGTEVVGPYVTGAVPTMPARPLGPLCASPAAAQRLRGASASNVGGVAECATQVAAAVYASCESPVGGRTPNPTPRPDPEPPQQPAPQQPAPQQPAPQQPAPQQPAPQQPAPQPQQPAEPPAMTPAGTPTDPVLAELQDFATGLMALGGVLGLAAWGIPVAAPVLAPVAVILGGIGGAIWLGAEIAQWITEDPPEVDYEDWDDYECVGFPASQPGRGVTYENPVTGSPISVMDMMMGCFCDAATSRAGGARLGPDASCGNDEMNDRRDCLMHPFGPDDRLRADCVLLLEEDNEPWSYDDGDGATHICKVIDCPNGDVAIPRGDSCTCGDDSSSDPGSVNHCEAVLCPSGQRAVPAAGGICSCGNGGLSGGGIDTGNSLPKPITPTPTPLPPLPR